MALLEKLQDIKIIKDEIKNSIENKGVDTTNSTFADYPGLIDSIQAGGGSVELATITDWQYMFYDGRLLRVFKDIAKASGKVTSMNNAFHNATITDATLRDDTLVYDFKDIDLSSCTDFTNTFYAIAKNWGFYGSVLNIDMSNVTTISTGTFQNTDNLKRLTFKGSFGGNSTTSSLTLTLSQTGLDKNAIIELFESIKENVNGKTRTIKIISSIYNELTEDEIAIITDKGYTISS